MSEDTIKKIKEEILEAKKNYEHAKIKLEFAIKNERLKEKLEMKLMMMKNRLDKKIAKPTQELMDNVYDLIVDKNKSYSQVCQELNITQKQARTAFQRAKYYKKRQSLKMD